MIELHSPREIEQMRAAGAFVAQTLTELAAASKVGVDLLDLDALAHERIRAAGATSCYIDYHPSFGAYPFGKVLCTSVNDAVLHGLPHKYKLKDGDLLSLDFAVSLEGWVADSAVSVVVGRPIDDPDDNQTPDGGKLSDLDLIATTERALEAAIELAVPGNRLGDISAAIGGIAHEAGLRVNKQFGGHGVGRTMHGDPHLLNDGRPGRGLPIRPGLVIAIEPWFMRGTDELRTDPDGWTLRSADGSRGAHSEHTIAVTEDAPIVLTARG